MNSHFFKKLLFATLFLSLVVSNQSQCWPKNFLSKAKTVGIASGAAAYALSNWFTFGTKENFLRSMHEHEPLIYYIVVGQLTFLSAFLGYAVTHEGSIESCLDRAQAQSDQLNGSLMSIIEQHIDSPKQLLEKLDDCFFYVRVPRIEAYKIIAANGLSLAHAYLALLQAYDKAKYDSELQQDIKSKIEARLHGLDLCKKALAIIRSDPDWLQISRDESIQEIQNQLKSVGDAISNVPLQTAFWTFLLHR